MAALAVFLIEIAIALWVHDDWVRPFGGDVLAVVLVYLGLRAVTRIGVTGGAIAAFAIGCAVEIGQALDLVDRLGLGHVRLARIILGTSFAWGDFLAYASGALVVLAVEGWRVRRH